MSGMSFFIDVTHWCNNMNIKYFLLGLPLCQTGKSSIYLSAWQTAASQTSGHSGCSMMGTGPAGCCRTSAQTSSLILAWERHEGQQCTKKNRFDFSNLMCHSHNVKCTKTKWQWNAMYAFLCSKHGVFALFWFHLLSGIDSYWNVQLLKENLISEQYAFNKILCFKSQDEQQ